MHYNKNIEVLERESISFSIYRLLTLNSYSILGILDKDKTILHETEALRNILGYENWERIGTCILDYIHPDDIEIFNNFYNKVTNEINGMRKIEHRAQHKNGHWVWIETNLQNYLNEMNVNAIISHTIDITERKVMQEKLIESEKKHKKLINMQGVGIGLVDHNERFIFSNPAADKIFETQPDKLAGKSLYDFLDYESRFKLEKETQKRKEGKNTTYQIRIATAKNQIRILNVTATPNFDDNMQYIGAYGVFCDITKQKQDEDELEQYRNRLEELVKQKTKALSDVNKKLNMKIEKQEKTENELRKFKTAFDTSIGAFAIADLKGKIDYVNQSCLKLWGYKNFNEVLGKEAYTFWEEQKIAEKNVKRVIKGEQVISERTGIRKDGSKFFATCASNPVINQNGKVIAIMSSIIDISEIKQYENELLKLNEELRESKVQLEESLYQKNKVCEELIESENKLQKAMSDKNKFFSIIAHDLRSPLSGFIGLSELMNKNIETLGKKELKEMSTTIYKSANSIYKLVEELLLWSKSQTGRIPFKLENVSLYDIVFSSCMVLKNLTDKKNIKIDINIEKETSIKCDKNMMNVIVRNLISNAIKFSFKGGKIIIDMDKVKLNKKSYYKISFEDNGSGIPEDVLSNLFKDDVNISKYGTEKESGSGLGLIICKDFVKIHGGDIFAVSKEDKGSIFYFTIPEEFHSENVT